jgi:hypothetical protein
MKITKIAHCTLLFEYDDIKVLVDPGNFTIPEYSKITGLSYLLISDVHEDHYDKTGIEQLLKNNASMKLIVTQSVNELLQDDFTTITQSVIVIENDYEIKIGNIDWSFGVEKHIAPYKDVVKPKDILWYQVGNYYFGSGDTFKLPKGTVEIMGQNVIATFGSTEQFIDYAIKANPKRMFNIHDGYLNKDFEIGFYGLARRITREHGIDYEFVQDGEVVMNN